jgi:protein gp37
MGDLTGIQWTDHTFNPHRGCSKVEDSPGCLNCYAEVMSHRNPAVLGVWGPDGVRAEASESYWKLPHKWNRAAEQEGQRHRVFCLSLGDWLEDRPELIPLRGRLLTTIAATPWLDWQLLTKRPEGWEDRMQEVARDDPDEGGVLASHWLDGDPPANVWVGASTENQKMADLRIPLLLQIPAVVRFLSLEPLLSAVDLSSWLRSRCGCGMGYPGRPAGHVVTMPPNPRPRICPHGPFCWEGCDWCIIGGESGPHRRPCEVAWIADIVHQCQGARVPVFVKQDAAARPGQRGRIPDELWIKEFPEGSPLPGPEPTCCPVGCCND